MSIESRIIEARGGDLIVGCRPWNGGSVVEAARLFGLFSSSELYFEVTAHEAEALLGTVLSTDMAYTVELVPIEQAALLAAEFIGQFSREPAKFYTNGDYGKPRERSGIGPSWMPATNATFDTGILVLCADRVACAWFMDED